MNKACKKYLGELRTLIPSAGKNERTFLRDIKANLMEFSLENSDISYKKICENFGTPQNIVINYFENTDTEYLIKRMRLASIIKKSIFVVILILAITCAIEAGLYYKAYREVRDHEIGYWTETIHD